MPQTQAIAICAMLPNLYLIFAIIISTPHVHPALVRQLRSASVWFSHCPYAFLPPSSHLTRQCVGFPPLTNCGLWSRAVAISSASITHTQMRTSIRGTDWFTPWPLHLSTHLVSPNTLPALAHTTHHHTTPTTPGPRHSNKPRPAATVENVDTMQTNFQAGGGTLSSCLSTGHVPTKCLVSERRQVRSLPDAPLGIFSAA